MKHDIDLSISATGELASAFQHAIITNQFEQQEHCMITQDKKSLIESYIQCYNAFDIDGLVALLADDVVFENEAGGEVNVHTQGKGDFKTLALQSAQVFSARQQTITNMQLHDDSATVDIDYQGTVAADLDNGLKAGQVIELQGQTLFKFSHGKISHIKDVS